MYCLTKSVLVLLKATVADKLESILSISFLLRLLLFALIMALIITPIVPYSGFNEGSPRVRFIKLFVTFLLVDFLIVLILLVF